MSARKATPKPTPRRAPVGAPVGNKNASKHQGAETERLSLRLPAGLLAHYRARADADGCTLSAIILDHLRNAPKS